MKSGPVQAESSSTEEFVEELVCEKGIVYFRVPV
jgi:hypothetical protein